MEYRLGSRRALRWGIPAVLTAAAMTVGGLALAARDDPQPTIASFTPAETTVPPLELAGETVSSTTPPTTAPPTTAPPTTAPPTTAAPTTTEPPAPTTTEDTLPAELPTPIAPPRDPRGYEDQIRLGGLSIPKLGIEAPLLEGIRLTTLDNGPGHWPGTAMPGEIGNVVVAGHRTSHGAPFRHIDTLVPGDTVDFTTETGVHTYVVTSTEIVYPDAMWIVDQTPTPTATLFACHPPGSVKQRIVVHLELAT